MIESRTITFDRMIELLEPAFWSFCAELRDIGNTEDYQYMFTKLMHWIELGHGLGFWGYGSAPMLVLSRMINNPPREKEWESDCEAYWKEFLGEIQKMRYADEEDMKADEE